MKVLEEDVEKSLQREGNRLDSEEQSYPEDVKQVMQELKSKHNVSTHSVASDLLLTTGNFQLEIEQLRKRMNEIEMKHARVVHDVGLLNFYNNRETHPLMVRSFTKR